MGHKNDKNSYSLDLMVPSYKFNYFYSLNFEEIVAEN